MMPRLVAWATVVAATGVGRRSAPGVVQRAGPKPAGNASSAKKSLMVPVTMIDPEKPPAAAGAREVILVVCDDLSVPGWASAPTPTLDRLAREGAYFENVRISGSDRLGVCAPSRASLLTGRYVFDAYNYGFSRSTPTFTKWISLPEKLRLAGYATTLVGKWHADVRSYNAAFERGRAVLFRPMGLTHLGRRKRATTRTPRWSGDSSWTL